MGFHLKSESSCVYHGTRFQMAEMSTSNSNSVNEQLGLSGRKTHEMKSEWMQITGPFCRV